MGQLRFGQPMLVWAGQNGGGAALGVAGVLQHRRQMGGDGEGGWRAAGELMPDAVPGAPPCPPPQHHQHVH